MQAEIEIQSVFAFVTPARAHHGPRVAAFGSSQGCVIDIVAERFVGEGDARRRVFAQRKSGCELAVEASLRTYAQHRVRACSRTHGRRPAHETDRTARSVAAKAGVRGPRSTSTRSRSRSAKFASSGAFSVTSSA